MARDRGVNRRNFFKLCASAVALVSARPQLLAQENPVHRNYRRARLVDAQGTPLTAAHIKVGENYVFHYPYVSTPCFLINLGRPAEPRRQLRTEDGRNYDWEGGAGPERSLVAFSAICAHKMTHPAPTVSFINYRHEQVSFLDKNKQTTDGAQVIYCCSEKSVYDPASGAQVLGGPAPQPLAAVHLEYDETDGGLYATGTTGGEMFDRFFNEFGPRISLEMRTSDIRKSVGDHTGVMTLAEFSQSQVLC